MVYPANMSQSQHTFPLVEYPNFFTQENNLDKSCPQQFVFPLLVESEFSETSHCPNTCIAQCCQSRNDVWTLEASWTGLGEDKNDMVAFWVDLLPSYYSWVNHLEKLSLYFLWLKIAMIIYIIIQESAFAFFCIFIYLSVAAISMFNQLFVGSELIADTTFKLPYKCKILHICCL